jgi:hypothetical protein
MAGLTVWGCGSNGGSSGGTDAGPDVTQVQDAGTDAAAAADTGIADAPCPVDVDLLAPVDALANPVTASCQACIVDSGPCLQSFEQCNGDCVCKEAVTAVATCIATSGNAAICAVNAISNPAYASATELGTLVNCQGVICAAACNPPKVVDAGTDAAADVGDAGSTPDAADGGSTADAGDAAPADASDDGG